MLMLGKVVSRDERADRGCSKRYWPGFVAWAHVASCVTRVVTITDQRVIDRNVPMRRSVPITERGDHVPGTRKVGKRGWSTTQGT